MMKRHRCSFAAALALLAVGLQAPPAAAQLVEFKAGIADPASSVLAWWMAEAGGFFARQGLRVQIPSVGGNRGLEALQAGRIDVAHRGLSNIVRVNQAGGDLRLIGSLGNLMRLSFFSAAGVKTAADLKGGMVAVSNFGAESDIAVTLALQRLGLTRNDVTIKEFGDTARRLAAVKSGDAKATVLSEPFTSLAREQGVNVMVDLAAERIPWVFTGIAVKRSATTTDRDRLKRFLRGTIEGNYFAFTDEKRAKEVLAKELHVTDPKLVAISYNDYKLQTPLNIEPIGAENTIAQFPGVSTKVEDYVDTTLLDEIRREGFITALQQKYNLR